MPAAYQGDMLPYPESWYMAQMAALHAEALYNLRQDAWQNCSDFSCVISASKASSRAIDFAKAKKVLALPICNINHILTPLTLISASPLTGRACFQAALVEALQSSGLQCMTE